MIVIAIMFNVGRSIGIPSVSLILAGSSSNTTDQLYISITRFSPLTLRFGELCRIVGNTFSTVRNRMSFSLRLLILYQLSISVQYRTVLSTPKYFWRLEHHLFDHSTPNAVPSLVSSFDSNGDAKSSIVGVYFSLCCTCLFLRINSSSMYAD